MPENMRQTASLREAIQERSPEHEAKPQISPGTRTLFGAALCRRTSGLLNLRRSEM
jgi:hypothetical protein